MARLVSPGAQNGDSGFSLPLPSGPLHICLSIPLTCLARDLAGVDPAAPLPLPSTSRHRTLWRRIYCRFLHRRGRGRRRCRVIYHSNGSIFFSVAGRYRANILQPLMAALVCGPPGSDGSDGSPPGEPIEHVLATSEGSGLWGSAGDATLRWTFSTGLTRENIDEARVLVLDAETSDTDAGGNVVRNDGDGGDGGDGGDDGDGRVIRFRCREMDEWEKASWRAGMPRWAREGTDNGLSVPFNVCIWQRQGSLFNRLVYERGFDRLVERGSFDVWFARLN